MKQLKISTKGKYALRMLLDLAEHKNDGFIALKDIAERQDISKKYLEQIVTILNQSDILRSNRGYQGGYMLAQPAEKYTVGQVLRVTEGSLSTMDGAELVQPQYDKGSYRKTVYIWQGLDQVIAQYLDSITLQDILDRYQAQGENEYYI
ncbi:MAG: RrF2 family transcriptional regulator [Oscillospiraceae bacterium]